jgi:DNA (cytosine-5)-methyltransferase 3A
LVSAQNRKRLYWTNIPNVSQPEDKGILVKDIIVLDESLIKHFDDRIRNTMIWTDNYIKYDLGGKGHYSQQDRLYFLDKKSPTIPRCRTETKFNVYLGGETYKKTCPIEIERLQTLPDDYTYGVPKTRRFEVLGNCWTVDVIVHIFKNLLPIYQIQ